RGLCVHLPRGAGGRASTSWGAALGRIVATGAQGTPVSTDPAPEPDVAGTRVLVVDDEAPLRRSLARLLETRGFAARAAEDGEQALAIATQGEVDVMLVDLMMPGMSGMEVLRAVKTSNPEVEVVMMTAFADVDTAVAAVRAGAYDFLTK